MTTLALENGITVASGGGTEDEVTFEFPDGFVLATTWGRVRRIELIIQSLRTAYESALLCASCSSECRLPLSEFMRIDELLLSLLHSPGPGSLAESGNSSRPRVPYH
jgi:hypothetical protein